MAAPEFKLVDAAEVPRARAVARSQWADAITAAIDNPGKAVRLSELSYNQARAIAEEARRRSNDLTRVSVTRRPQEIKNFDDDPAEIPYVVWVEAKSLLQVGQPGTCTSICGAHTTAIQDPYLLEIDGDDAPVVMMCVTHAEERRADV